jgi:hypothetical protein
VGAVRTAARRAAACVPPSVSNSAVAHDMLDPDRSLHESRRAARQVGDELSALEVDARGRHV